MKAHSKVGRAAKPIKAEPQKRIFAFGDNQIDYRDIDGRLIPLHSEPTMRAQLALIKDLKPDIIVNGGDTVDLPQFSKFDPDSVHFARTLNAAFERVYLMYKEIRQAAPKAEIHEVDSNHNARLRKAVLRNMKELDQFRVPGAHEPFPLLSYATMANLKEFDVNWHSGYGAAAYKFQDDLIFIHGEKVRSNGSTADLLSKTYPYCNVVAFHGHKMQTHYRTAPDGTYYAAVQVGCSCDTLGVVPGYGTAVDDNGFPVRRQMDWQNSALVVEWYGEGFYTFEHIPIRDGMAFYRGKLYA